MTTTTWIVQFRGCDPQWAATQTERPSYAGIWERIPWNKELTITEHTMEYSARDQFHTLKVWEEHRAQPVKDVELFSQTVGDPERVE